MQNRTVDLSVFKKQVNQIASRTDSWNESYSNYKTSTNRIYSKKEIEEIINTTSTLESKRKLSRSYFEQNGFYKKILMYYATVLYYNGILTPNSQVNTSILQIKKTYNKVLNYLEKINIKQLFTNISLKILIDGVYFGVIKELNKKDCIIIELPTFYCRSNFKDYYGNDIVEFNVSYFDTILSETSRAIALKSYPSEIESFYRKWKKGKTDGSPWIRLSAGICFYLTDSMAPFFLDAIEAITEYDESIEVQQDKEKEEVKKIIVQKIPHIASTGELVFEPQEAYEMHEGAVNMMRGNKNVSVLTTYADVEAVVSKTTADTVKSALTEMRQNIYSTVGASQQIFAPEGSQALPYSIKNDITLMMILATKYSRFITYIVNELFGNTSIYFTYDIIPVGEYNRTEYLNDALKLAQNGYSFILPSVAMGINQSQLVNLKNLENNALKLDELLIPLSTSYTQSSGEVGRPKKDLSEKADKTIQNEDSIDHQGGTE